MFPTSAQDSDAPSQLLLRLALPAAAGMAILSQALSRGSGADVAFLFLLTTGVLYCAAALTPTPWPDLALGGVLAATAVWSLPAGPSRGAAVTIVLIATLATAARRLFRGEERSPWTKLSALALGLQLLLRPELLLGDLNLRAFALLLVLPLAAAAVIHFLAKRHGQHVLLAAAALLVLLPGWSIAGTLTLVALAAGGILGAADLSLWARGGAGAALLAIVVYDPRAGAMAAAAALALAWPRLAPLFAAVAAAGALVVTPLLSAPEVLALVVCLPLFFPALMFADADRRRLGLASLLLAWAAARVAPQPLSLAAPLALAALSTPRRGTAALWQRAWTAGWLSVAVLIGGYPWLRRQPLRELLPSTGQPPALMPAAIAALVALIFVLTWEGIVNARERLRTATSAIAALALLLPAVWLNLPHGGSVLLEAGVVTLDLAHPLWNSPARFARTSEIVIDSLLTNAGALAKGTPVAQMRLRPAAGPTLTWTLRAGEETGEWAARRPDVAAEAPPARLAWAEGRFLGQLYRARWRLPSSIPIDRVEIERSKGLPAGVTLSLSFVGLRR